MSIVSEHLQLIVWIDNVLYSTEVMLNSLQYMH